MLDLYEKLERFEIDSSHLQLNEKGKGGIYSEANNKSMNNNYCY